MAARPRSMRLATTVIGAEVKNPDGEHLGTIDDLIVDVGHLTGALAVVKFGGFLGFGEKTYAIPVEALEIVPSAEHFMLSATVDVIKNAPEFHLGNFADYNDDATLNTVRDHYLRS